jgi:hypothetical protein
VGAFTSAVCRLPFAVVCACLAVSTPALAQVSELTSNRPGISESEALLVPRAFQLESGFTFARFDDRDGRHSQVDFPEATLRFGFTERFEAFVNGSNLVWNRTISSPGVSAATTRGSDFSLNAKVGLLSEDADKITLSAAMGLSLPVGSEGESSDGYDPSLRLLWAKDLPRGFWIAGNLNISSETVDDHRHALGSASLGLGNGFVKSSSWFVELFGDFLNGESARWQLDGGFALAATTDMQFDISAGRTLQSGPPEWFVAAGISLRHRR